MTSSSRQDVNSSVLAYHRIIEAFKFGYAWRSQLGDPDSVNNSQAQISKVGAWLKKQSLISGKNCTSEDDFSILETGLFGIHYLSISTRQAAQNWCTNREILSKRS